MGRHRLGRALAILAVATFALALPGKVSAARTTFHNPSPISIPDEGAATPYPSTIQVSGLAAPISDIDVTLRGFSHTCPNDVAVLLVAPDGATRALLMADLGEGLGCPDAINADLTFDDAAAGSPPYPPASGTYRPTDGDPTDMDVFPPPAPSGTTHSLALSTFNGTSPNGTWSLYVLDQAVDDAGAFAQGWSLTIDAPAPRCKGKPATLTGTSGNDVLTGTSGKDVVAALSGNDRIATLGGKDVVCAGGGNDKANGGGGNDRLLGQGGNDKLKGVGGRDNLRGGGGRDNCNGGPGTDKGNCEREKSIP